MPENYGVVPNNLTGNTCTVAHTILESVLAVLAQALKDRPLLLQVSLLACSFRIMVCLCPLVEVGPRDLPRCAIVCALVPVVTKVFSCNHPSTRARFAEGRACAHLPILARVVSRRAVALTHSSFVSIVV